MGQVIRFGALPHPDPAATTGLSEAEHLLLGAVRTWVSGFRRAEQVLCGALLAAPGAALVLGPIVGLGGIFAIAGLFFPRRARTRGLRQ
jgi:hypothetical protein